MKHNENYLKICIFKFVIIYLKKNEITMFGSRKILRKGKKMLRKINLSCLVYHGK